MGEVLRRRLREWYIVLIAVGLMLGGLYVASLDQPATTSGVVAQAASSQTVSQSHASGGSAGTMVGAAGATALPSASAGEHPIAPTSTSPPGGPLAAAAASGQAGMKAAPPMHEMVAQAQPAGGSAVGAATTVVAGSADSAAGRQVFRKCQACHSVEPGKNMLGPSLGGIIGRKAGTAPGYSYSPAMNDASIVWDAKSLDAYLTEPEKVVPGNKMPFPGLKTDQDRADVIAYLATAGSPASSAPAPAAPSASPLPSGPTGADIGYVPDAKYTLRSGIAEGRMVYMGVGGEIEGKVNPVLTAAEGQVVQLTLINGEGAEHDIVFPGQDARSPRVTGRNASTTIAFRATKAGDFTYFCSVPGHQLAGMQGQFVVTPRLPAQAVVEADISREPTDLPPPVGKREPQTVRVDLLSVEVEGRLAEGTTFGYWTFNGKVPGPFLRVRVGDTVDIHLKNSADSSMIHSVDFHATTGPGGGAAALQVDPGGEKSMTWKALVPGLYVYHCATPMVAEHIANGMYGLILVEPEGGLPPVDREFYVMQGEIYTDAAFGQRGSQEFSVQKLLDERPEYFVFNGSVGALTKLHPLRAKVGETVRIFFGVGGPNYTSSFHVIGAIFDKVYALGGVASPPLEGVQTVTVPAGGAMIGEIKLTVPGNYTLVDHALARLERGLVGILNVEGPPNAEVYNGKVMPGMGH
jgi:nitrite reductase (NO-forming)